MIPASDIPAVVALHDAFGLTAKEAMVVLLMARSGIVDANRIRDVYCDNPNTTPIEARSAVKRIRKKTGPVIKIKTHYGVGYELEAEARQKLREMMRGR